MGAGPTGQPGNATPAPDNVGPGNVGEGDDGGKDDKDDDDNDDNDRGGNDEGDEIGAVPATADGTNGDAGNDLVKNGGAVNAERAPYCGQHKAICTQTYFKRMRLPDYNNVSQKKKKHIQSPKRIRNVLGQFSCALRLFALVVASNTQEHLEPVD